MTKIKVTRLLLFLAVALFANNCVTATENVKSPHMYWEEGSEYYKNGQYSAAIENYTKAIENNKGELKQEFIAGIHSNIAVAYIHMKMYPNALEHLNMALKIKPEGDMLFNIRGATYYAMKRYDLAVENYTKSTSLNPKSDSYYYNRGQAYLKIKSYNEALSDFNEALKVNPKHWSSLMGRVDALKKMKMYTEALQYINNALASVPNAHLAHFHKAAVYSLLNKENDACDELQIAVKNGTGKWSSGAVKWENMSEDIIDNPDFDNIHKSTCFKKIVTDNKL